MNKLIAENVKNLEMVDFSMHLSEKCKAETGTSVVKQVSSFINYAELRDKQRSPEAPYGTLHKHTVY